MIATDKTHYFAIPLCVFLLALVTILVMPATAFAMTPDEARKDAVEAIELFILANRKGLTTEEYEATLEKIDEQLKYDSEVLYEACDNESQYIQYYNATLNAHNAIDCLNRFFLILDSSTSSQSGSDESSSSSQSSSDADSAQSYNALVEEYKAFQNMSKTLGSMEGPAYLTDIINNLNDDAIKPKITILEHYDKILNGLETESAEKILSGFAIMELEAWSKTHQANYATMLGETAMAQLNESKAVLTDSAKEEMSFEISHEKEISPNLYPSLDSAINIKIISPYQGTKITVSAEIVGFSQPWESTVKLDQGLNILRIKPEVLASLKLEDLKKERDTQAEVKITDEGGKQLEKQSLKTKIRQIYSFTWADEEFGVTSAFNILAWLRPDCAEVEKVLGMASDTLKNWRGNPSIIGYQNQDDISTLLEVAAIQKAISDSGVSYQMDNYNLSGGQNILTPDAVIQNKHGLCIETTLLMASCLKKIGLHPVLVITPGHAQCAYETSQGSGNYYLLETTLLPFDINTDYEINQAAFYNGFIVPELAQADAEAWNSYLSSKYNQNAASAGDELGGIFIIDCDLLDTLDIKGLDI